MTSVEIWKSSCDVSINGSVQSLFNFAYHTKLARYKYTRNKIGRKTEIKRGKQKHGADILERATLYWSEWPGETRTSFSRFGILALYCSFTNMANFRRKTVIKLKGRNYPTVLRVSIESPALFGGKSTWATSNGHSRNSLSTFFASSAENTYNDNNSSISYGLSPFFAVLLVDFVH